MSVAWEMTVIQPLPSPKSVMAIALYSMETIYEDKILVWLTFQLIWGRVSAN